MRLTAAMILAIAVVIGYGACGEKKRQKRTSKAAPVEVISTSTTLDGGTAGRAATSEEAEPNDSADVATTLPVGGSVRAKIDPDNDPDYFRIEVTEAGVLAIEVDGVDADLTLEIEDAAGAVIAKSDRGPARVKEGVPNLGVRPGRYTAVVRKLPPPAPRRRRGRKARPKAAAKSAPVSYHIAARLVAAAKNGEREPDDDRGTANDLILGDPVTGFVGWTGDDDVWKLSVETLSAKNSIDVEVSAVEGVALSVELVDGVGRPLLARKAAKGATLFVRGVVPVVPSGAPPFHYVTVKGSPSNPETAYQLRVFAKPVEPDAEIEPNDVPDKAMEIPADRTVVHAAWSGGDVDCFAIPPDLAPRTVQASVTIQGDADLSIELLIDGKVVAKGDAAGKGAAERASALIDAGVRPVLRVRGVQAPGESTYTVNLHEGPASVPSEQ